MATPETKPFLRKNSGLQLRRSASTVRRYTPKGGFVKHFEELDETPAAPLAQKSGQNRNTSRSGTSR